MKAFAYWAIPGIDPQRTRAIVGRLALEYGGHPLMRWFVVHHILNPGGVPSHSTLEAVRAIHAWVRDEIRFVPEVGEQILTPARVILWRFGDCDDRSGLVCALLESIKIPWRLVLTSRGGVPFHIHPQAWVPPRGWIDVETSHPSCELGEAPHKVIDRLRELHI